MIRPEIEFDESLVIKVIVTSGHRWLTAVILATQEAEIKKIMVQR
jgi:hypothetical protein